MGRISRLADPGFALEVATAWVEGHSRSEMCALFDVHKDTISAWKRDPRVTAIAKDLHDQRIVAMTRKIDSEAERRLNDPEILSNMSNEELLKFRKEIRGEVSKVEVNIDRGQATSELWKAMDEDPGLAGDISAMIAARVAQAAAADE